MLISGTATPGGSAPSASVQSRAGTGGADDDGNRHGAGGNHRCGLSGEFGEAATCGDHAADEVADDGKAGQAAVGTGQRVELAAQGAACPEQQRLDRADADIKVASDAVVRPALFLAQPQDFAMARGHAVKGLGQDLVVDPGDDLFLTAVDHAKFDLGVGAGAAAAAVGVDAQPRRDHAEPGIEAALAGELRHRAVRADERLLREFFGFVRITDALQAVAIDALEVAAVEIFEGATVTRLEHLDENSIPPEIYIVGS